MIEINLGILIAQIVTFSAALFVIWKIAWGPLTQMMRQREENIRRDIEKAKDERVAAEDLKKSYEEHLAQTQVEAQRIFTQAAQEGQHEREKIMADARVESEKLVAATRRELQEEKNRLVKELRSDVTDLAVKISEKLIQKSIDKSVQDRVFNEMVKDLGASSKESSQ